MVPGGLGREGCGKTGRNPWGTEGQELLGHRLWSSSSTDKEAAPTLMGHSTDRGETREESRQVTGNKRKEGLQLRAPRNTARKSVCSLEAALGQTTLLVGQSPFWSEKAWRCQENTGGERHEEGEWHLLSNTMWAKEKLQGMQLQSNNKVHGLTPRGGWQPQKPDYFSCIPIMLPNWEV